MSHSAHFTTSQGTAQLYSRQELLKQEHWQKVFLNDVKDHRYYNIIEQTLDQDFRYNYLVLKGNDGALKSIQPVFLVNQDMLAGAPRWINFFGRLIRKIFPRFFFTRMLMVGCAAGESHLGVFENAGMEAAADALHESLFSCARFLKTSVIVLKDFPSSYRNALSCFSNNGYIRFPSMPATKLRLDFKDFDDFLTKRVSRKTRKNLRQKISRSSAAGKLEMEVVNDISPYIDQVYPLYLNVLKRSKYKFEQLTREYFCRLGKEMPDKVRYFIWRFKGKIVAFSLCMIHDEVLFDEYIGLDYDVAFDLHLYHCTLKDLVEWAVKNGMKYYHSTPLNYEPKYHLRYELVPLDLYVTHTSNFFRPIFHSLVSLVQPTRDHPILKKFANADEL